MAQQDVRLLGSALSLHSFTNDELAQAAGVNLNTARAWVNRNGRYLATETGSAGGARGRPRRVWRIADDARETLLARLRAFDLERLANEAASGASRQLDRLQSQLEAWALAKKLDQASAPLEERSLRQMIRLAWEDMSAVYSVAGVVEVGHSKTLAEIEHAVGAGAITPSDDLRTVAIWIAETLDRMQARDVSPEFGARVVRWRADVRTRIDQIKVTAAALAAPVWGDEGLVEEGAPLRGIAASARIAELIDTGAAISHLGDAISGRFGFCRDAADGQATLRGMTARRHFKQSEDVPRWLFSLKATTYWQPAFAPVALHGASEGSYIQWENLLDFLRQDVHRALARPPQKVGELRRMSLDFAARAIGQRGPRSGEVSERNLDQLLKVYTYRPGQAD